MRLSTCPRAPRLRRPPHGGRGLKFAGHGHVVDALASSSTRRTWIEIATAAYTHPSLLVVLHTEDVD